MRHFLPATKTGLILRVHTVAIEDKCSLRVGRVSEIAFRPEPGPIRQLVSALEPRTCAVDR